MHFIATLDVGGAEKQLLTLCTEQVAHDYQVTVIPLKGSNFLEAEFKQAGVIVDNSLRNRITLSQYFRLCVILRSNPDGIIHAHSAKAQVLLSAAPYGLGKRLVLSKHDAMQYIVRTPGTVSRLFWNWVQRRFDYIVLISNAIREAMNLRGEYVDSSKAWTSHYGISSVEVSELEHSRSECIKSDWGLENDCYVVGTVGRLVKEKNHVFLLQAFQEFLRIKPNAILVICGYGPEEDELQKWIHDRKLGSRVKILNDVKNARGVYAGFDVFVLPSLTEGFGLVILEAMAANLPIIASNVGAIPEILGTEYNYLFNPTNIRELSELLVKSMNPTVRDDLIREANIRFKSFSSEAMFNRIDTIYKSLGI